MTSPTSMGRNRELIKAQSFGFWIGTKRAPRRAVRWENAQLEDGRASMRGRNWVEVLSHAEHGKREPERFFGADVEYIGPHEWLTYHPHVDEPVCGWGRPRLPEGEMQYCPRVRQVTPAGQREAFCPAHMRELQGSQGEETDAGEAGSHSG